MVGPQRLAVDLHRDLVLEVDLDLAGAPAHDGRPVLVMAVVEACQGHDRPGAADVAGARPVEPAVVEAGAWRRAHAAAEIDPVRRDDREEAADGTLPVDADLHRLRTIRRDGDERPHEVAPALAHDPGAGPDALGDVPAEADPGP